MKKRVKKLALSKETVRDLGKAQIQAVIGASGGGLGPGSHCITECCVRQDTLGECNP
jgi:hypothetical protein